MVLRHTLIDRRQKSLEKSIGLMNDANFMMNIKRFMISKVLDRRKVSKKPFERVMICSKTDEMLSIGASSTIPKSKDFLIGNPAKEFRHSSRRGKTSDCWKSSYRK